MDFFIDRAGTFTDCLGVDPEGALRLVKVPSSDRAPLEGIRSLLGLRADQPIPACRVRMGTTLATKRVDSRARCSTQRAGSSRTRRIFPCASAVPGHSVFEVAHGDRLRIETPGGGYGAA